MRNIWRYTLAPLALGAAIFASAAPAAHAATASPAHVHPLACPAGSHWDESLGQCVSG